KTSEACFAVWRKLFAIEESPRSIDDDITAAQVIGQDELGRGPLIQRMRRASSNYRNALLVIHNMDAIIFAGLSANAPTVMLEGRIDISRRVILPTLIAHQFLRALSRRVVQILDIDGRLGSVCLSSEDSHLIRVIPFKMP